MIRNTQILKKANDYVISDAGVVKEVNNNRSISVNLNLIISRIHESRHEFTSHPRHDTI